MTRINENASSVQGAPTSTQTERNAVFEKGKYHTEKRYGFSKHLLYPVYNSMRNRCHNPNDQEYKNYGERGIFVCDEWRNNPKNFYDWAFKNGYKNGLSIDRIDNNGGYEPSNCRWITHKEQCHNKRVNHILSYNGKTQNITQWADELGIDRFVLYRRINKYKWDAATAFSTPILRRGLTYRNHLREEGVAL